MLNALILFFILSSVMGLFLLTKPEGAIELQRRFYEKINWKMEPISLAKEIRNVRLMGLFLIIFALLIMVYILLRRCYG